MSGDLTAPALREVVENTRTRCRTANERLLGNAREEPSSLRADKAEGVRLALSYLDEEMRVAESDATADPKPVDLSAVLAAVREDLVHHAVDGRVSVEQAHTIAAEHLAALYRGAVRGRPRPPMSTTGVPTPTEVEAYEADLGAAIGAVTDPLERARAEGVSAALVWVLGWGDRPALPEVECGSCGTTSACPECRGDERV